jgi:hypothetical protein
MTRIDGAPDLIERFNINRPKTAPSKGLQMAALEQSFVKAVNIKDAFDFSNMGLDDEPSGLM